MIFSVFITWHGIPPVTKVKMLLWFCVWRYVFT